MGFDEVGKLFLSNQARSLGNQLLGGCKDTLLRSEHTHNFIEGRAERQYDSSLIKFTTFFIDGASMFV